MTVKLADYGIRGGWMMAICDGCGKRRSCHGGKVSEDESMYFCVVCLVRDIEANDRYLYEGLRGINPLEYRDPY